VENIELAEHGLVSIIQMLRLATEAVAAFWIAVGFVNAVVDLTAAHLRRRTETFTPIRLMFSRYLSLALEFQLAADILSTAISPSWQQLGQLGATAVIRTGLNYSLP
jgi:uncharacterized membrane protein